MRSFVQFQAKPSSRVASLIAVACAFIFIVSSLSPAIAPPAAADNADLVDLGIIGGSAVAGAALGGIVADGPGAVVGAIAGALFGLWLTFDAGEPNSDYNDPVDFYAMEKAMDMRNMLNMSDAQAQNLRESFEGLTFYYARKAEAAAAALYQYQRDRGLSYTFDSEYVLREGQIYDGSQSQLWATMQTYNEIFAAYDDLPSSFVGTYAPCNWGLYVEDSLQGRGQGNTGTEPLVLRLNMQMTTIGTQTVIINPAIKLMLWKSPTSVTDTYSLQLYNSTGALAYNHSETLADDQAVSVLNLTGVLPLGRYHIDLTAGWTINGLGAPSPDNSGTVIPVLDCFSRKSAINESLVWKYEVSYYGSAWHRTTPASTATFTPAPKLTFTGSGGWIADAGEYNHTASLSGTGAIPGMFSQLTSMLGDVTEMYSTVVAFGQTAYNLIKATGGAFVPPPVDMIFLDASQLSNWSWQQLLIMYNAYMSQVSAWYYNYSMLTPDNVSFSAESLDLVLRGELRDENNATICDNSTVMTPFVSLYNMTLDVYEWSYFNQPGFVMIWGNTSLAGGPSAGTGQHQPVDSQFNISICRYIQVHSGWSIKPYEMIYENEYCNSLTLHVTSLNYVVGNVTDDNPPPQSIGDWQWILEHWYYFGLIAGGCMAAIGIFGRSFWMLVAAGAVILVSVCGYFLANWGDIYSWFNPFAYIRSQVSMWWWY